MDTISSDDTSLTALERSVLDALLARPAEPLGRFLRSQAQSVRVVRRELTGVGFFAHLEVPNEAPDPAAGRLVLSGVGAEIEGLDRGAGFVLFVEGGLLDTLEGFTYDEAWPATISKFRITPT